MPLATKKLRNNWTPPLRPRIRKVPTLSQQPLRPSHFILINIGLLLGNILVLFNTGAVASISLHATGALSISPSHASWLQTYYFISLALALPVSSWLAARSGAVNLFIGAMVMISVGSLLCSVTHDLGWFLLGRILQGFSGGLALPVSQTLLLNEYPQDKKPFSVSLWSIAAMSPLTLGPAAGGWLEEHYGWRWLFYLNMPLPLMAGGLVWSLLYDRHNEGRKQPFDVIGFILLAIALACLQTLLNIGQDEDWYNSNGLLATGFTGLLALAYFTIWEWSQRHPLVNVRLFAQRNFAVGAGVLSVAFLLVYGLLSLLLARLQSVVGYSSFLAGSVLLPLVFFAKPIAAFCHRFMPRYDARWLASLNMLAFAGYCYWTSCYDFFQRGGWFTESLGSQILEGFCLGGLFAPLTMLFLSGLSPRRQAQAAELGTMLRVLGGSVGSPLLAVLWERRSEFHQHRLAETLSAYEPYTRDAIADLEMAGLKEHIATFKLAGLTHQHAAILGVDDVFRSAAWLFLALALLVWLARTAPRTRPITAKQALRENALETLVEEP